MIFRKAQRQLATSAAMATGLSTYGEILAPTKEESAFGRSGKNVNTSKRFISLQSRDKGLELTSVISHPRAVVGPMDIPSRADQIQKLKQHSQNDNDQKHFYDILVIGGGATGAGIALDAVTRGNQSNNNNNGDNNNSSLSVACIERGDFSSETSSRSTKLIWAGIKYMATATATLLNFHNITTAPIETIQDFMSEMKMVYTCHQERYYMMTKNQHLCNWIPIVIPFNTFPYVSYPQVPFQHALFGFFPVLAPMVLKFYDALSYFTCPPSYVLTPTKAQEVFPQLRQTYTNPKNSQEQDSLKYCAVFYEAQHNDARTNLSIAMTAAKHGADICNYIEMINTIHDEHSNKVIGIIAQDKMTGDTFPIYAKHIVFAGGPFTDELREMEQPQQNQEQERIKPAVKGAAGTHIIVPNHVVPHNMGLLDYNTTDGRFLFILPWENHTLIGTTDVKNTRPQTLPTAPHDEIDWLLKECQTYLNINLQRSDVKSSWRGWRPLAVDPHASESSGSSRDHVISENPNSGIIFIAGGKWTTWREMAQEVVDRIVNKKVYKNNYNALSSCKTLQLQLIGGNEEQSQYGLSKDSSMDTSTIETKFTSLNGIDNVVAKHLIKTYGCRSMELYELMKESEALQEKIVPDFPYIKAEVVYACHEYACTVEDVLSRRTRLAFLNQQAAEHAIPVVAEIMANELGWSKNVKEAQMTLANKYIQSYT